MTFEIIGSINQWFYSFTENRQERDIIDLLEFLGMEDVIHLVYTPGKLHIESVGRGFDEHDLEVFTYEDHVSSLAKLIDGELSQFSIIISKKSYSGFNISQTFTQGRKDVILIHDRKESITLRKLEEIIKLGFTINRLYSRYKSLENSLKFSHAIQIGTPAQPSVISKDQLSTAFLEDTIPAVFYSVLNEEIGPMILGGYPKKLLEDEYQLLAVNIYSGIDSEMITELGHIYTSTQIKNPELGELINLIFTVANTEARGNYEFHTLSILLAQEFVNLSKSIIYRINPALFYGAEKIRQHFNSSNINVVTDSAKLDQESQEFLNVVTHDIRTEIGLAIAELLDIEDVINW